MSQPKQQLSREDLAKIEIGHTDIARGQVWTLFILFLLTIVVLPAWQQMWEIRAYREGQRTEALPQCYDIFKSAVRVAKTWPATQGTFFQRLTAMNAELFRDIHAYEDELEESSRFGIAVLPSAQHVLTRWLGAGNEKTYPGLDGWLFYRPEIDYLTGPGFLDSKQLRRRVSAASEMEAAPHPDPVAAIAQFREQLARRGIPLVVMPAPIKPMVQPEKFSRAYSGREDPVQNPSYAEFIAQLRMNGVQVFDAAEELARARRESGQPQYLATDTHWRPEAMERVAEKLAELIRRARGLPEAPAAGYTRRPVELANRGDIALMLQLSPGAEIFPPEPATIQEVRTPEGRLWQSDGAADVLFLGDSFCNIYSLDSMGWGAAAGFVEQVSFYLQRPLDRLVRNDSGAFATRHMLSQELAKGRDRLAGKRVVVWEFAARELAVGDWKPLEMVLGQPPPPKYVVPEPGQEEMWSATVAAVAPAPKPGSVPYKDHIVAIHLVEVATESGPVPGGEALVYAWSMRNNVWEPAARLRAGQQIHLRAQAWADVAGDYEAINRAELDDERLTLEEPCWGEVEE
jgi:hypothetical protein